MPAVEEDVLGLDVAVNDAVVMGVRQSVGDFHGDAQRFIDRQVAIAVQARAERHAFDERHYVVQHRISILLDDAGVEEREDVRMPEPCRGSDFGEETLGPQLLREIGVQHLDRNGAVVLDVAREIHSRHATRAELALDTVAVGERRGETIDIGQDGRNMIPGGRNRETRRRNSASYRDGVSAPRARSGGESDIDAARCTTSAPRRDTLVP